ncbi:MAG: hypothetical protein IJD94_05780 [Clostridia bacterium]|nr:hypothetical protein [Clostridia bacterium]
MTRFFAALLLLLLLPGFALALDLSGYAFEMLGEYDFISSIAPLAPDECAVIRCSTESSDTQYRLQRIHRGEVTFDRTLPGDGASGYSALRFPDGRLAVVRSVNSTEEGSTWKQSYILFPAEDGSLTETKPFEGDPYDLRFCGGLFAGVCEAQNGQTELMLYDGDTLAPVLRYGIAFENAFVQAITMSGGAHYLLIKQHGRPSLPDCIVLRIEGGEVSWAYHTTDEDFHYNNLHPDGDGGVILSGSLVNDYKRYRLTHLSAEGKLFWSKTLETKNAITHPACVRENGDGTATLYGYCVAKSRDLYTIFAMTLNPQGEVIRLDVRDYSAREDTGPQILLTPEGEAVVYSFELPEKPAVYLPFFALPQAGDPGIHLR